MAAAMIDLKHLDPSVREVVFSGPSDRKRVISDLPYIRSPIAEPALDAIRHWGNSPRGGGSEFVLIEGDPQTGKGALLEEAHRRFAADYPLERRSVLYRASGAPTRSRLIHQLIVAGEVPHLWSNQLERHFSRVRASFERENVRVLLANKLHDPAPRRAGPYLTMWRGCCEELGIHGAFSVGRRAKKFLADDPTLGARTVPFELIAWPAATRWVIVALEKALSFVPLPNATEIDADFMETLYGLTGGYPGRIFTRLKLAAALAIDRGDGKLNPSHLVESAPGRAWT